MRHSTTQALVHRFAGLPSDVVGFSSALRRLAASSVQTGALGVMLAPSGEVLAIASATGRVSTWTPVSIDDVDPIEIEFEGDGWFRTEHCVLYVHRGQPWVLTRNRRLALSQAAELPSEARRVPDAAVTPFMISAADCIEAFTEVAE
jgi:hypothetical protein